MMPAMSRDIRLPTLLLASVLLPAADWRPATWRDCPAWSATADGWTATVCPAWGRLVSLRSPDGEEMLHMSDLPDPAAAQGGAAGGHQAWLGPQTGWGWPPPRHWEYAAAVAVRADGPRLTLELPAGEDPRWPQLTRRYAWHDDRLELTLAWHGDRPLHALQVVQVRGDALVRVQPVPGPGLPHGFAVATAPGDMLAPHRDAGLPQPDALAEGGALRMRRADPCQKWYLPTGPITAEIAGWRITMTAGEVVGTRQGRPDDGLTTQVFLGSAWDMIEIEQASPLLSGDGELAATVELAVGRAGGVADAPDQSTAGPALRPAETNIPLSR